MKSRTTNRLSHSAYRSRSHVMREAATIPEVVFASRMLVLFVVLLVVSSKSMAGDWPMWRYDAARSAASGESLPDELQLLWTRKGTPRVQAWDDPLNLDLMSYDRLFEPIVAGDRMFVGCSETDKLMAIDTKTGSEVWSFYTDAPIRLAPAAWNGLVFTTSDDGRLYCLDGKSGKLRWQFQGAAGSRKVIGNRRLISAWPARGGVVVRDDKVYFATSIWPFMGVFIYALDAETGRVEWVNDSSGSTYIKQPHSAPSFAGIGPQGALAATTNELIVPGGRSVPAVFDRQSGALRYYELNAGGKGTGGSTVMADDSVFYVHTRGKGVREFHLNNGLKTAFQPNEPVLHGEMVYSAEVDEKGIPVVRAYNRAREKVWEVPADGRGDLILAGSRLYAAGTDGLCAVQLPESALPESAPAAEKATAPCVVWRSQCESDVQRLLAAHGRLFAVTQGGDIHAFGVRDADNAAVSPAVVHFKPLNPELDPNSQRRAAVLMSSGTAEGYALWFGAEDEPLLHAVASENPFVQLAVVDENPERVERLRRHWDASGLYGKITAHHSSARSFDASPYMAHMVFVHGEAVEALLSNLDTLKNVYESVRPYGGTLLLLTETEHRGTVAEIVSRAGLEQAEVQEHSEGVLVRREGSLPGSASWTHLHGDIGNTRKSNDARVRLPLGILWFGGSSNVDVLPRHGHGPPQQVSGGRLFIQGINVLSARDVYTGRVLWKKEFTDLGTYDVYYDSTYKETPLDPAYNQVHIPGANARGTNYVVTEDRIYVVEGAGCHVIDPATGESLQTIELPQDDPANPREWSFIGVYGDVLIGGAGFAKYRERLQLSFDEEDSRFSGNKAGFGSKSFDRAGSLSLVGFDRRTGRQLWKVDARHSFWNNAIVAGGGRIYCLDRNPRIVEEKLLRRGLPLPSSYRVLAFDAQTGATEWQTEENVFGTWLGYSEKHDLLLQAGAAASDRLVGETDKGMTVVRGVDGSVVWSKPDLVYSGPCILHNDLIITNANSYKESAGAFYLKNGQPQIIRNPVTGENAPWKITRAYGCNTILASENMLTFRSGAAGFYDLTSHSGTGNLGGFKSGCTGNLIAADGVLNAPDYTRTCSCSYQNQTSLALVHMPEIEMWTLSMLGSAPAEERRVESVGINFGAPGHHRAPEGTLWIEWPNAAGDVSPLSIESETKSAEEMRTIRRHSSSMTDSEYPWIFSSGLEGDVVLKISTWTGGKTKPGVEQVDAAAKELAVPVAENPDEVEELPQTDRTAQRYKVRLFFGLPPGQPEESPRVFDVLIDGMKVLENVSIRPGETVIRELPAVSLGEAFRLQLVARQGKPVISGVEILRESR